MNWLKMIDMALSAFVYTFGVIWAICVISIFFWFYTYFSNSDDEIIVDICKFMVNFGCWSTTIIVAVILWKKIK